MSLFYRKWGKIMKKYMTRQGELSGFEPKEVDAEVNSYSDITEPGIYAVQGVNAPVSVTEVTPYGASYHEDKGNHVENGMVFIPTGWFVD